MKKSTLVVKKMACIVASSGAIAAVVLAITTGASAASSAAAVEYVTPSLSLNASPTTVAQGDALTMYGALSGVADVSDQLIIISWYDGNECTGDPIGSTSSWGDQVTTDGAGDFSALGDVDLNPGTYAFVATTGDLTSNCVVVTVTAGVPGSSGFQGKLPPPPNNVFLCYSAFQDNPGVWSEPVAKRLLAEGGYWQPYAVPGNVAGGTNIGDYHLVCNLASGQSASDSTLGGAGEVYEVGSKQDVSNVPGHYPIVGK